MVRLKLRICHGHCYLIPNSFGRKNELTFFYFYVLKPGQSVVNLSTAYELDGPGIKSRWGEIFRICPDRQ